MTSNTAKTACQSKQMVPICDQFSQFDGTCALLSSLVKFSDPISTSRAGLPQEALAGTYFYTGYNGGGLHTSAYNGGYFSVDESKGARDGETWCVPDVGQSFKWKGYMFETVKVPKIISGLAASAQCVQHGEGWTAVCSALQFYKNEHSAIRCQPFDAGLVQSPSRKTVMQTFATDGKEYLDKVRGSLLYNELSTMTTLQPLGIITDNPQGDLTQTKSRYVGTYTLCIKRPGEWLAKQGK